LSAILSVAKIKLDTLGNFNTLLLNKSPKAVLVIASRFTF
jgi:hypothetical protein